MFVTIAVVLFIVWALGRFTLKITRGMIHALLVGGVVFLILHFIMHS